MTHSISGIWKSGRFAAATMALAIAGVLPVMAHEDSLDERFDQHVRPFLAQHCVACHNPDELTSGIRLDHLNAAFEDRQLKLWRHVRTQIESGKMPPDDEPQPSDEARRRVIEWIEEGLTIARARPTPKNGGARRLTVAQYRNTIRELLLLDEDLTSILPADGVSQDGFVNNQETLVLSPLLIETYFEIAEKALGRCIVDVKKKPAIQNFRMDLGDGINPEPCPDKLILGAFSSLLDNADFRITQLTPMKPFEFEPLLMQTRFRFHEGYEGNETVRGWREYDSIYHAVFACMRGMEGYPKGEAYSTAPQGLLLRPAIPSAEVFGLESTYGPRANFKISLRELPDHGRFRLTVKAAKYDDGLLLDPGTPPLPESVDSIVWQSGRQKSFPATIHIPCEGIYQVDVYTAAPVEGSKEKTLPGLRLTLGDRQFSGALNQPAFMAIRLAAGDLPLNVHYANEEVPRRIVFTRLPNDHELAIRFAAFERRTPQLGVHLGVRRDCGSTLNPVGAPQAVKSITLSSYVFEGAIGNFPSPDVQKDNDNYLSGIREIGVRSEYTDGRDMPRLLIRSVEFEGPLHDCWPPQTHRNIFIDSELPAESPDYARHLLRQFATRAYRRPVTAEEETSLMTVFARSRNDGASFTDSVKDALLVVLVSPQFLFLIETSTSPAAEPLDEYELAAKLSYFLWNGPPDSHTTKLAEEGELATQLDAEVTRLLSDERSLQFVSEFTSQWLALDKFRVLEPDRNKFPKLTRLARGQLEQEPPQFVQHLIRHNLPVSNLVAADFVVANDVVADFYELSERANTGFQFVVVPHRRSDLGGVFGQAAIMAGLSDGRESNPVKRGAWLARRIIAEPPDDPPPNVPQLKEETKSLSLRERLEQHRNQTGCAQCHATIDPWGIPLEQFDASGRYKDTPTDVRSTLPDKTEVNGAAELKRYLAEDRLDQVAFSVLKHLTTYAIGRSLSVNELDALRRDSQGMKTTGYRMQDMIRFVVHSDMFLEK